jgi:hypothetical protein
MVNSYTGRNTKFALSLTASLLERSLSKLLFLLSKFFRYRENADKLAEIYYENADILLELKKRFPDWENYLNMYLSAEVRNKLIAKGVPI